MTGRKKFNGTELLKPIAKRLIFVYHTTMINHLTGTVIDKAEHSVILEVGKVGYKIFTTTASVATAKNGQERGFWTHLAVRENALDLYGFADREELEFFELLITVSGVGPKSALGILNLAEVTTLKRAIGSGDPSHLTKVSGIGQKSAQKIVLELKEKMGQMEDLPAGLNTEVLEALTALGYSAHEARQAIRQLPDDIKDTTEQIKEALKRVNSQ